MNGEVGEQAPKNEATIASQNWLTKNAEQIKKWVGNSVIAAAGEFMTILGGVLTPISVAASVMFANPLFLLGTAPSVLGTAIEWGGAKNASPLEKTGFLATKLAMAGGAMYTGPLAYAAMGISGASGLLAQRHRQQTP